MDKNTGKQRKLTEVLLRITPALAFRMDIPLRAVLKRTPIISVGQTAAGETNHERVVKVPNLVEEMDLIFARKQCSANAVYRGVPPTLLKEQFTRHLGSA